MIVHGVLSLDVGGLERIVVSLAKAMPSAIICVERLGVLAGEAGVPVISLDKPPGRDARFIDIAEAELRKLNPHVVHTHQIGAAYYLAAAARRLGIRVVHSEHGNAITRTPSQFEALKLRTLFHRTAKKIDAIAAVSEEIAGTLTRYGTVPRSKVSVVPNGIEVIAPTMSREAMRASLNIPVGAFAIGSVGRLHEVKRQHLLLEITATIPDAFLLLVGDGPERSALEALATTLGITHRVHFAGYQASTANYYAAMDAFVLSSRSEGFPVSLLEAWAARVPAVVAAVGGLPGIVVNHRNGVLVKHHSLAMSYTFSLGLLRTNAALRDHIIEQSSHDLSTRYSLTAMASRYRELYGSSYSPPF